MADSGVGGVGLGIAGLEDEVLIGRGGFAVVYRAYQPAFRRTVAVKVVSVARVDALTRERFERECQAMGLLSEHPGIVTVLDAGFLDDGRPYLVMAYMTHGSMEDRLEDRGPLGWEDATRVGVKLAGALDTAHQTGVIHRDVKPANVLISQYGEPQLSDFGIARVAGGPETTSGVITASLAFAPPEVIEGQHPTVRSDVYSLAATLYALLDGRSAFQRPGESIGALINRVLNEPPADLRVKGVPEPVWDVVARGLEKDPEARFESAADLGRALRDAEVELGVQPTDLTLHAPPVVDSDGVGEADVATETVDSGDGEDVGVAVTAGAPTPPEPEVTETVVAGEDEPPPFYRRRPVMVGSAAAFVVAVVVGVVVLTPGDDNGPDALPSQTTDAPQVTEAPQATQAPQATTLAPGIAPVSVGPPDIDQVLRDLLDEAPSTQATRALACPGGLTQDFSGQDFSGQFLENADFRCANLQNADFSGSTLRNVSFLGADLGNASFENALLVHVEGSGVLAGGAQFGGAVLIDGGARNGDFTGSDFSNAFMSGMFFEGTVFDQATLRGAFVLGANIIFASMHETDMTETKLYYSFDEGPPESNTADWTGATCPDGSASALHASGCRGVLPVAGTLIPLSDWCPEGVNRPDASPPAGGSIDNTVVRCVDLSGLDLRGTDWTNSILIGVDFSGGDLTAASFGGSHLFGVTFDNTTMSAVRVASSQWYGVDADGIDFADPTFDEGNMEISLSWMNLDGRDLTILTGPLRFNGTRARGANLTGLLLRGGQFADLAGADLTGATLLSGEGFNGSFVGATMRGVQMSGATMDGSDLSNADLTDATAVNTTFRMANLSGAIVVGADFTGATWNNTVCPDGTLSNTKNLGRCDV